MPAQLFVDSDMEDEDFDSGGSDGGDSSGADDDLEESVGDGTVDEGEENSGKGKKRKSESKKETKKSKKLKKLGPKESKEKKKDKLTSEEIKELTAKEYEQYSNLYNVQIEEVLQETEVPEGRKAEMREWVKDFKLFLKGLSKTKKFLVGDYKKILKPVQLPLPEEISGEGLEDGSGFQWMKTQSLQWLPPSNVDIKGSWSTNTALHKVSSLDLFLEMPYDYLHKSDNLNHKYHVKRAIYLGYLAKKLEERGNPDEIIKFTMENGERLKPVISLTVHKVPVLIHAVPPKDFFCSKKLACDKNNLRFEHFFKKEKVEDEPESSTQHYNLSILQDSLANEVHDELFKFMKSREQIRNAVKLIKIWLTQRELSKGYGGFSGLIISQFARYLWTTGKINDSMTSFQIIRIFFINLIQLNLTEKGISFCAERNNSEQVMLAHMQWDIVFLDSSGYLNFTGNLSKYTYARIQEEAKRALKIIDQGDTAGFTALFLTKVKFLLNFDHIIRFKNPDRLSSYFKKSEEHIPSLLDHSGFLYPIIASTVGSLIEKSLKCRISIVDCQLPETPFWETTDQSPSDYFEKFSFGLVINHEPAQRIVEKCESDTEEAIAEFKSLWGNKSELRRFKDGTLLETVSLENLVRGFGRSRICFQMLNFIFYKHLQYKLGPEEYIDRQVEDLMESKYVKLIPPPKEPKPERKIYLKGKLAKKKMFKPQKPEEQGVSVDEVSQQAISTFDDLSKILRQLNELPLQISTVQGTSSVLRFSHIQPSPPQRYFKCNKLTENNPKKKAMLIQFGATTSNDTNEEDCALDESMELAIEPAATTGAVGLPNKLPKYIEPIGVIIHLETSGSWPDNMEAIERLKCAFLLKIGELLGKDYGLTVQAYPRFLDVLKDGFVFRLKITYFRELTILRELRGSDGILRVRDNPESIRLEKESLILPQLTSTLHAFHQQYEAFGKTCRIAKRWIASQLLLASPLEYNRSLEDPDCRITEEAVEILVASLFINYAPHLSFPSEAHVGFQRFLYLLANTDFKAAPVIVNFNDKLDSEAVSTIELEFVKQRSQLPTVFISTPFDQLGSVWTRNLSPVILGRMQLLAKQALSLMEAKFDGGASTDISKIFKPTTTQFDVIIKLKKVMNPRAYQNLEVLKNPLMFHEYKRSGSELLPVVDFDPVQMYLQELRNSFGHMALFLHDSYGGQFIAVVWKPDIFKGVGFANTTVKGRQRAKKRNSLVVNVSGALESFQVLGNGLIDEIQVQSEKWKFDE